MRLRDGWACLLPLTLAPHAAAGVAEALPAAYARLAPDDIAIAAAAVQVALEEALSRDSRRWHGGTGGASGVVTPLRTFRVSDGRFCREYLEIVFVQGEAPASGRGTACRRADGMWEPVAP